MIEGCEANRARLAISRSDQHLLAQSAMRGNQRGDRLWVDTGMTEREGDYRCRPCNLAERIRGHCGELSRGGHAAQGWGRFA